VVHVAHKVEFRIYVQSFNKNLSGRDTVGDLGIGGRGILKSNFKEIGRVGLQFQKGINLIWM